MEIGDVKKFKNEYAPTILKEDDLDYMKDFNYGGPIIQLRPGIEVKNQGGKYYVGNFNITATGNINITGVGFKPGLVKFYAATNIGQIGQVGIGYMTELGQGCTNVENGTNSTTRCIYFGDPVQSRAIYVSMNNDGFTINCDYFLTDTYVNYECYK